MRLTENRLKAMILQANQEVFADKPFGVVLDGRSLFIQYRKEMSKRVLILTGETRELALALVVLTNLTRGKPT